MKKVVFYLPILFITIFGCQEKTVETNDLSWQANLVGNLEANNFSASIVDNAVKVDLSDHSSFDSFSDVFIEFGQEVMSIEINKSDLLGFLTNDTWSTSNGRTERWYCEVDYYDNGIIVETCWDEDDPGNTLFITFW